MLRTRTVILAAILVGLLAPPARADSQLDWVQASTPVAPPPRGDFAETYDAADHYALLIDGAGPNICCNDTWKWDGSEWTDLHPETNPAYVVGGAMTFDPTRGNPLYFE